MLISPNVARPERRTTHVLATAGHVDHGKSLLVQALTGMNPDRLLEEQRRGLTIELGFAWARLNDVDVAFVDVPGHQRFVPTMLMGVGPVPAVLLVVAADDGWMPQTQEHFEALLAIGVRHVVVAITKSDVAAPGRVQHDVEQRLRSTTLEGSTIVAVSSRTGYGLDRLRDELVMLMTRIPGPNSAGDVRLWVDRVFDIRGRGLVVTGTLGEGSISVEDNLELWVNGTTVRVRVRGLQSMNTPVEFASGVSRVALNLTGAERLRPSRGSVIVAPNMWHAARQMDVLVDASTPLPKQPILHFGGMSKTVHARPLGPGALRLTSTAPLPVRVGDRGILRDPGNCQMWGIQVLDPMPPAVCGRGSAAKRAAVLASMSPEPDLLSEVARRGVTRASDLARIGVPAGIAHPDIVRTNGWLVSRTYVDEVSQRIRAELESLPGASRFFPGITRRSLAQMLGLEPVDLIELACHPPMVIEGGCVRLAVDASALRGHVADIAQELRSRWAQNPYDAPSRPDSELLGLDARTRCVLEDSGVARQFDDEVLLAPNSLELGRATMGALSQPFTVSEARIALGANRRVTLALLHALNLDGLAQPNESGTWRCASKE